MKAVFVSFFIFFSLTASLSAQESQSNYQVLLYPKVIEIDSVISIEQAIEFSSRHLYQETENLGVAKPKAILV